jgi:hypothetical protein
VRAVSSFSPPLPFASRIPRLKPRHLTGQKATYLTSDNQMTPKPNLALNAEIESSGRVQTKNNNMFNMSIRGMIGSRLKNIDGPRRTICPAGCASGDLIFPWAAPDSDHTGQAIER